MTRFTVNGMMERLEEIYRDVLAAAPRNNRKKERQ
jgi:hypothetical protein